MLTLDTPRAQLMLERGQTSRLRGARHTRLTSTRGTLWVTIDNDPRDFVLEAGEAGIEVDSEETLLISAMGGPAVLELRSAKPSTPTGVLW